MNRYTPALTLLLLLPATAWAQPAPRRRDPSSEVTVENAPPGVQIKGLKPDLLKDYLAAVKAVEANLDFAPTGKTRDEMKVDHVVINTRWETPPGGGGTKLVSATITPEAAWVRDLRAQGPGGARQVHIPGVGNVNAKQVIHHADGEIELEVSGLNYKIRRNGEVKRGWGTPVKAQLIAGSVEKVTIDGNGKMKISMAGLMPDVTVTKMTRDANGNLRLHTSEWIVPDIIVEPDGKAYAKILGGKVWKGDLSMLTRLEKWPPTLQDFAAMMERGGAAEGPPATGIVRYDFRGTGGGDNLPLPGGLSGGVGGEATMRSRGAVELKADGSITQLGDADVELELRVGSRNLAAGPVRAGEASGHVAYRGRYRLSIPQGDANKTSLVVDGDVSWALNGKDLVVNLPTGARVAAGNAELSGSGRLNANLVGGAGSFTLADGKYRMRLSGPVSIEGVTLPGLRVGKVGGNADIASVGTFSVEGDKVSARGDLRGRLTATDQGPNTGLVEVLTGDKPTASGRVVAGSTVDLNLDEVTIGGKPKPIPNAAPEVSSGMARGKVKADVRLADVSVLDTRITADGGRARVVVDANLNGGMTRGNRPGGSVDGTLTLDADLARVRANLPGGSVTANDVHVEGSGNLSAGGDGIDLADARLKARLNGSGELEMGLPGGPVRPTPVSTTSSNRAVVRVSEGSVLNLRAAPSRESESLAKLPAATPLDVLSSEGEWSRVKLDDGRTGFVASRYLAPAGAPVATTRGGLSLPGGTIKTRIEAGSEADVALDRLHVARNGAISAEGKIVAAKVLLGTTELRAGMLQAKIIGSARASIADASFAVGPDGVKLPRKISVPIRIELGAGSTVALRIPGKETELSLDKGGSYAEMTAHVVADGRGGFKLDEMTKVDLKLVTTAAGRLMGNMATVNGEKSLEFKGRVKMTDGGLDLYGDLAVRVRGDDRTPILSLRF